MRTILLTLCGALALSFPAFAGTSSDALRAGDAGQWDTALALSSRADDPVTRDIVQWMYLLDGKTNSDFQSFADFLARHPDWPNSNRILKIGESKMPENLSPEQVLQFFGDKTPQSEDGMRMYLTALLSQRKTQQALYTLKSWWVDADLTDSEQADMLDMFQKYLSTADHQRRLEKVLNAGKFDEARALGRAMGPGWTQLVEIRIALKDGRADQIRFSDLPKALLNEPGLLLAQVQAHRLADDNDGAMKMLLNVSPTTESNNPEAWAKERNIVIRRLIEDKRYREAYALAESHQLPAGSAEFANTEFMAGWLALRFLNQPQTAFDHFEKLFNNVKTPISRSRGAYWAGRAADAAGTKDIALQWYQLAARYQTTWYGQLAAQQIGLPTTLLDGLEPKVTSEQKAAFNKRSLVAAIHRLDDAGLTRARGQFFNALLGDVSTPQEYKLLSSLALDIGQLDAAVKVAKKAEKDSVFLTKYAYPVMRDATRAAQTDPALVHALIRQESQFDPYAESPVGALGLMQLMPTTAAEVARKNDISSQTDWLTSRPSHNVTLGSLYIRGLMDKFDGYAPMAVAAYNAGPGRVNQWVEKFGDPRSGTIDMVDWVELIPVQETRNYVQRVLEARVVYNQRIRQDRVAQNNN